MVGAIVNNNIVPLDYKLKDDDIVKINTNNNSFGPSKEWLNIAKTNQAKNKIRGFFNKLDKEEYLKNGEDNLNKELRKKKIGNNEFFKAENVDKILKELKCSNLDELYINIGNGKFNPNQVINVIYNDNKTKEEIILDKVTKNDVTKLTIKDDIIVKGIDQIKINIASCCKPIPNDKIIGYITKGYGITVHRSICPNINNLTERIIDVKWNEQTNKKYPTNIVIHTDDDKNILMDIIAKTSNSDITIQSINSNNNLYDLVVLVTNDEKLNKFMNDLKLINNVTSVERTIK